MYGNCKYVLMSQICSFKSEYVFECYLLYRNLVPFQQALGDVQPSAKREGFATIPDVTWDDIGALEDIREELTMAIIVRI